MDQMTEREQRVWDMAFAANFVAPRRGLDDVRAYYAKNIADRVVAAYRLADKSGPDAK